MTAREKAEFERVNALQRKLSGRVDYYYKPQTKYPPRIYIFMHAEIWRDRNRRPMGLFHAIPFLSRPMNREEIEYHHFDIRLCYHQYEDWDKLIYAEEQEAEELDKEMPGAGIAFLEKLKSFQERYVIGASAVPKPKVVAIQPENEESRCFKELMMISDNMTTSEILDLLEMEQKGPKRITILFLLREYLKNRQLPDDKKLWPTEESINRKVQLSLERSRKNFVRRIYHKNKLFALEEIRMRYPDYTEIMLLSDLQIKSRKTKRKKHKPVTDLRRCQLEKLAARVRSGALDEKEYHQACCRIVMLQNAHDHRLPIPLSVTLNNKTLVYSFSWRTRENVVKSFVVLANAKGMNHDELGKKYKEMVSSGYSY